MSLKGSLQTAALPEVLNFLSDNAKTGQFHVSGSRGEGRLWLTEGRISGFQAAKAEQPSEAIFELLRIDDGEFEFEADVNQPADVASVETEAGEVGPALEAAEARMAEWLEIVKVVPSLSHRLQLRDEKPGDMVMLEPEQWMLVVAVGAGASVGQVIDRRGMQEFEGCQAVRTLVDASLVEVSEPAEDSVVEEPVVEEPVVEQPVAVEASGEAWDSAGDDTLGADETAFSGALLRFGVDSGAEYHHDGGEHHHEDAFASTGDPIGSEEHPEDHQEGQAEGDRYAALRAAVVEIGDDLGEPADDTSAIGSGAPVYELEMEPETDPRAALQALLSEVTTGAEEDAHETVAADEPVDGLADRGPWTDHELSVMDTDGGWNGSAEEASNIVPFAPVHTGPDAEPEGQGDTLVADDPEEESAEDAAPTEEPINRGLLLKFLSSVRN